MTYSVTITPSHDEEGKSVAGDNKVLSFSIVITDPCVDVTLDVGSQVYEGTTNTLLSSYEFTYELDQGQT